MHAAAGFLRRKGPSSDADIRRHSYYLADPASNPNIVDGRASEQIPRKPPAADFLSPLAAAASSSTRMSSDNADIVERPVSPEIQEASPKHQRFSLLKFRHASDSQLATRARLQQAQAENPIPQPTPPEIITTAPTLDMTGARPTKKKPKIKIPNRNKADNIQEERPKLALNERKERRKTMSENGPATSKSRVTFDEPHRPATQGHNPSPPAYGDESASTLALPATRLSESSRSDASSGDHGLYASTTTTTHTVHTTTTFFRLPRRKKHSPLFDLSHLPQKSSSQDTSPARSRNQSKRTLGTESPAVRALRSPSSDNLGHGFNSPQPSPTHSVHAMSSTASIVPSALSRQESSASTRSSPVHSRLNHRGRSSTLSSLRNVPTDELPTPTLPSASTRTSTSTGRKSFHDIFNLSYRLRQNSEPPYPRHGSGPATPSSTSKNNSMQLTREPIVLPERYDDDTPAKYLVRLEEAVSRGVVASVLSKGTDPFSQAVLRSYMRGFGFFGDPMDMAIRKLLMEVELPKETQQIDRCLQSFANRYHECNPGIYASPDQAYFVAFSLLILHTDVFNKNNKHKMQKADYLKNIRGEGIFDEILECFYDNISYTPFIHVEDDLDINGERIIPHKVKKKSIFPRGHNDPVKRPSKDPVDPYTLIMDSKLDTLRPNLKDVMHLEEHYSYLGTAPSLNLQNLQKTFFRTGILQIISARSRPDAFMSEKTVSNPDEAHPGIVDIKITKVGLLWRKDAKKKKTRSPWQEWGAILTGAQLYFFRNTTWIKSLMHQYETHIKQGHDGIPIIFKPPLDQFKPDALMSTDDAVALLDSTYKKHKNAFVFVRHGGFEETFLADNEDEMNDWLAKLNYAAAFRTSGVRMRGVVGGNYEGQRSRGIRRFESHNDHTKSVQTPTGEVTISSGKIDVQMAHDILAARREIMQQKIKDAEEKLETAQKQLDAQLRNARHLMILAPIQNKTRDHILHAASRMSAQLKWGRMEIWRLKCHKDILTMDLNEEKGIDHPRSEAASARLSTDRATISRLNSKASTLAPHRSPRSPPVSTRPSTASQSSQLEPENMNDMFATPLSHTSSFHKQQASWELPPLSFDGRGRKPSFSTPGHPSPNLMSTVTQGGSKPLDIDSPVSPDAAEQAILKRAGLVDAEKAAEGKRVQETEETTKEQSAENDKLERGKIRRSLHRTLREAHVPMHSRSKKGKDSSSSANMSEGKSPDDVLSRGTGSFVVHGKKASVITFGSELQSMSPDERLRLRKQPNTEGLDMIIGSPATMDDFQSTLAEPFEYHERHGSAASVNTAISFRELQRRLSPPAIVTDDDDEAAVSFSEGRSTPMPTHDDEDENEGLGIHTKQAIFYTPDVSRSPTPTGSRDERPESRDTTTDESELRHEIEDTVAAAEASS